MSSSPDLDVRPYLPGVVAGDGTVATDGRSGAAGRAEGFAAGRLAGYAVGYSEGMRRAAAAVAEQERQRAQLAAREQELLRARLGELLLQLRAGAIELDEDVTDRADELAAVVARCAARLAQQVVLDAAPTDAALLARVRRALADVPRGGSTTVQLATAGVRTLERAGLLPDGLPDGVVVVADDRLRPGDVVVRSGSSTLSDLLERAVSDAVAVMTAASREQGRA